MRAISFLVVSALAVLTVSCSDKNSSPSSANAGGDGGSPSGGATTGGAATTGGTVAGGGAATGGTATAGTAGTATAGTTSTATAGAAGTATAGAAGATGTATAGATGTATAGTTSTATAGAAGTTATGTAGTATTGAAGIPNEGGHAGQTLIVAAGGNGGDGGARAGGGSAGAPGGGASGRQGGAGGVGTPPLPVHATITFSIDDSANRTYEASSGLAWKGSFSYDADTNYLTLDNSWNGPFVPLYDDGPQSQGGHEPPGATAGDQVWSVAVFMEPPGNSIQLEYGAIRGSVNGSDGDWIWVGSNGVVSIPAGSTSRIDAPGLAIPAFGTIDFKLTVDAAAIQSSYSPASTIQLQGSPWDWSTVDLVDDGSAGDEAAGDGIFTILLSQTLPPHRGLLSSGDAPQFVVVIDGAEYRNGYDPSATGVTAYTDATAPGSDACLLAQPACTEAPLSVYAGTYLTFTAGE